MLSSTLDTPEVTVTAEAREGLGKGPGAWSLASLMMTPGCDVVGVSGLKLMVAETLALGGAWSRDADVLVRAPGRQGPDTVTTGGETPGAWSRDSTLAIVRLGGRGRGEPETVVTVARARDRGEE